MGKWIIIFNIGAFILKVSISHYISQQIIKHLSCKTFTHTHYNDTRLVSKVSLPG